MVCDSELVVSLEEVVDFLKQTLRYRGIYQEILYHRIVAQRAQERHIIIASEEIQAESDRQRREHRLEKAADTFRWLAEHQISAEDWEIGIHGKLLRQKLKESLFESEVERYFAQNRLDFDQVVLYQVVVPYDKVAQELFYQIEEEEISFYTAAHFYDLDPERRLRCGYEGNLYRWSLKPEISAIVFGAAPKQINPPVQSEQGYHLIMVEEFLQATLTPEVRQTILDRLFEEWLTGELNYLRHKLD